MKIKVEDKRLGIFVKNGQVIFSIISIDKPLIEEIHIALTKQQALKFLNRALREITKGRR